MTALVVEDEPLVLGVFCSILQMHGFTVLAAETAGAALDDSNDRQSRIDLVVVDRILPDASGIDVALKIRSCRPGVLLILTSGTPLDFWEAEDLDKLSTLPKGSYAFLQKPFTLPTLTGIVDQLFGRKTTSAVSAPVF